MFGNKRQRGSGAGAGAAGGPKPVKGTCAACHQAVMFTADPRQGGWLACPRCTAPMGWPYPMPVAQGGPSQMILSYDAITARSRTREAFQREAQVLAALGWRVAATSEGSTHFRPGAGMQPDNITVTYTRDA